MGHKIKSRKHPRHGTQCVIQYPTNRNPAQSLQENAITVFGPQLHNSLPKYLRDIKGVKTQFDKFLEHIPDEPKMPKLCHHIRKQQHPQPAHSSEGSKEFTKVVDFPTQPWSSLSYFETSPKYPSSSSQDRLISPVPAGSWPDAFHATFIHKIHNIQGRGGEGGRQDRAERHRHKLQTANRKFTYNPNQTTL